MQNTVFIGCASGRGIGFRVPNGFLDLIYGVRYPIANNPTTAAMKLHLSFVTWDYLGQAEDAKRILHRLQIEMTDSPSAESPRPPIPRLSPEVQTTAIQAMSQFYPWINWEQLYNN